MMLRRSLALAMAATATLAMNVPARAAVDAPITGMLPHGGTYAIYADRTLGASAVDLWFRAPDAGFDDATPGIAHVAAIAAASAPLESGHSLAQMVHLLGGDLNVQVYPDIVGVSVTVPTSAARRIVAAMTAAYFTPKIDAASLLVGQKDAAVLESQQRYLSDSLLHNAVFAQLFANGPAHVAPIPNSVAALTNITVDQAQTFAERAFRSTNATLTVVGGFDETGLDAVTSGSPGGRAEPPIGSTLANEPKPVTTVVSDLSGVGIGWVGPGINDERAATAMDFISDYLFRSGTGTVAKAVDRLSNDSYVSGQFITLHDPGIMLVTIGGSKGAIAKQDVLDALTALETPMDAASFEAARSAFLYHLFVDTQTPASEADNLGWYAVEGNAAYAPGNPDGVYAASARALDPAFVASVVKQYFSHPVVVQLAPLSVPKEPTS